MNKIQIKWEGPLTKEQLNNLKGISDYGIYQVYGDHPIYGDNVLLYIGQANAQNFATRIPQHQDWFDWKEINMNYYVGRLGSIEPTYHDDWENQIHIAESKLIHYCQPAWNSSGLNYSEIRDQYPDCDILNYGDFKSLPKSVLKNHCPQVLESNWKRYDSRMFLD